MKIKKKMMIGIVIVIGLVWLGKKYWASSQEPRGETVPVKVTHAQITSLPLETKAIGTLAGRSVDITSQIAGQVESIDFQDGAFVTKNTVLVQLDDAIYRAQYHSAAAQLAYSQNNYKRMVILGKEGAIAKQAIDQAEAELKEKKASAEESEVTLNKMQLLAPFDGVVGKRQVHEGDYVTVGKSVVTITDTNNLHIEYNVPEKYLSLLKLGQEVKITTDAYPGQTFLGKVAYISPTINAGNRSVDLYADVPNVRKLLAAGMLVEVTQYLGTENKVIMVPSRSVVPVLDGEQVYTVVNGKAVAVPVVIGRRTEKEVQIVQGLSPDAVVITDGQLKVRNGEKVKVES